MKHLKLDNICQQLLSLCQQQNMLGKPICIAYSGGVDSQVLLHALATLNRLDLLSVPLKAVHVNHGLSDNAAQWQQSCKEQARQYEIDFETVDLALKPEKQQSLESLAREARYQQLARLNDDNAVIMTAHHQDDQVETFLLALKRGAGVQGLSAMQEVRSLTSSSQQLLARPLLNVSRDEIEQYAEKNQLAWVEDESNADQQFDRNFIRAQVLPLLQERWPAFKQTVARSAQNCQNAQGLLDQLASQDFLQCQLPANETGEGLCIESLSKLSPDRVNNVIRYFLNVNQLKMPSSMLLKEIVNACFYSGKDKNPEIHLEANTLRCFQRGLYLTRKYADVSDWRYELDLSQLSDHALVELPDDMGTLEFYIATSDPQQLEKHHWLIDSTDLDGQLTIAFNHHNPKCLPSFRQQRRPLKKVLQELKVPTWQRKRLPYVFFMEQLVTALPLFVCKEYLVDNEIKCLNIIWHNKA